MKYSIFCITSLLLFACGTPDKPSKIENDSLSDQSTSAATENELSAEEKEQGWRLLFDGKTLEGWKVFKGLQNDSWEVVDGTLHCKPFNDNGTNMRSDLITEDQFANFELVFDWKIAPQGNSGVIYRATEAYDQPYASGPEYQLLDDRGYPGDVKSVHFTGAAYDMYAPSDSTQSKPAGTWNASRIVVSGKHVEHWLNGVSVVSYDIDSPDWTTRKRESKWHAFPGYGAADKGHIDLQDHGNEVWFRNIKIRQL